MADKLTFEFADRHEFVRENLGDKVVETANELAQAIHAEAMREATKLLATLEKQHDLLPQEKSWAEAEIKRILVKRIGTALKDGNAQVTTK